MGTKYLGKCRNGFVTFLTGSAEAAIHEGRLKAVCDQCCSANISAVRAETGPSLHPASTSAVRDTAPIRCGCTNVREIDGLMG